MIQICLLHLARVECRFSGSGLICSPGGLPSGRTVSLRVHSQLDRDHSHLVATAPVWARLLQHDVAKTPHMTGTYSDDGARVKRRKRKNATKHWLKDQRHLFYYATKQDYTIVNKKQQISIM